MEKELNGVERRRLFLDMMSATDTPISGSSFGKKSGVSRQVVVQDMALLRTQGYPIMSTTKGYYLQKKNQNESRHIRTVKVCHTNEQVEDELNAIVDLGGIVIDVIVNHRTYGKMTASLNIKSRRDVQAFVKSIKSGKSAPLLNVTSGYHFHRISAENEDILDEIEETLQKKGYLAEFLSYEENIGE